MALKLVSDGTAGSRRAAMLTLLAALALGPALFSRPAVAEAPNTNIAKVGAWMVGGQLGLAALIYFRNTGAHQQFFDEAKFRAKEIGIEVKDFPPRPVKSTEGILAMLEYFNQGDGARIAAELQQKYGVYHATLYDVSSHLYHIPLLYDLDPTMGDKLVARMRTNLTRIKVPDKLWQPVADVVAKRKSFDDVKTAVVQMDKDVLGYLIRVARGEEK